MMVGIGDQSGSESESEQNVNKEFSVQCAMEPDNLLEYFLVFDNGL